MAQTAIKLFDPIYSAKMPIYADEVLRSGKIASGHYVELFEQGLAKIAEHNRIVSMDSAPSAMRIALQLCGVKHGDKVATLAFNCLQSNAAIKNIGARPVWIDIDPLTMSLSLDDLRLKIRPDIKALIVYHVSGYPADIDEILNICRYYDIKVIEDCNNALGGRYRGEALGKKSDYAVYSFYPNRQINAIDGGALTALTDDSYNRARRLRRFGLDASTFRDADGEISPESDILEIGWAATLSNLHAAVGYCQLDSFSKRMARSKEIAKVYCRELRNVNDVKPVQVLDDGLSAYWTYMLLCSDKYKLMNLLRQKGIDCSGLHCRNDIYRGFESASCSLTGTDTAMRSMLAIPCGWWLSDSEVEKVVSTIRQFS